MDLVPEHFYDATYKYFTLHLLVYIIKKPNSWELSYINKSGIYIHICSVETGLSANSCNTPFLFVGSSV
jgi:hypothetical protein